MTSPVIPSSIGTVRDWMRGNVPIVTTTGQRQYFEMPRKDRPLLPLLILYRVGGAPDDKGQDYADLVIESWGKDRTQAESVALVVAREIIGIKPVHVGSAWVKAGRVNVGPIETTGTPDAKRYRIDATFHICSSL